VTAWSWHVSTSGRDSVEPGDSGVQSQKLSCNFQTQHCARQLVSPKVSSAWIPSLKATSHMSSALNTETPTNSPCGHRCRHSGFLSPSGVTPSEGGTAPTTPLLHQFSCFMTQKNIYVFVGFFKVQKNIRIWFKKNPSLSLKIITGVSLGVFLSRLFYTFKIRMHSRIHHHIYRGQIYTQKS
jgi:hypothetical protein